LFKFRIKVLETKRKPNSPPSWVIDPYKDTRGRGGGHESVKEEEERSIPLSWSWSLRKSGGGRRERGRAIGVLNFSHYILIMTKRLLDFP
jgi:hypothetical protein